MDTFWTEYRFRAYCNEKPAAFHISVENTVKLITNKGYRRKKNYFNDQAIQKHVDRVSAATTACRNLQLQQVSM